MNIGVAADGPDLRSLVSEKLSQCNYLLIVNISDFAPIGMVEIIQVNAIKRKDSDLGVDLANILVQYNCEASITGELSAEEFDILADACITRYFGADQPVVQALENMEKRLLDLIRNLEGTDGCDDSHHRH